MKHPRVLVVSSKYPPEYAGSGLRAHRTYLRLRRDHGIDFDVLCGSVSERGFAQYVHEGVRVTRIARKLWAQDTLKTFDYRGWTAKLALRLNYFSEGWLVWQWLKKHARNYDLIHVFGNADVTSVAVSFASVYQIPLLVEITLDVPPRQYRPFFVHWLDRTVRNGYPQWVRFVCISKRLEKNCRDFGITQSIWTRPNPVDEKVFKLERQRKIELRTQLTSFSQQDKVIVNVSKFMPIKNQTFLVDVLRHLPEEYKLVLAGPVDEAGPNRAKYDAYRRDLKDKLVKHGLANRIFLKEGFISNVDEYLKMADVYAFPSIYEGLGTPMLEAICCGLPVVAHRIEGITDCWVNDGENGYLSALDPVEFAGKIRQAVDLSIEDLDEAAYSVFAQASTRVIDEQYVRLINDVVS